MTIEYCTIIREEELLGMVDPFRKGRRHHKNGGGVMHPTSFSNFNGFTVLTPTFQYIDPSPPSNSWRRPCIYESFIRPKTKE